MASDPVVNVSYADTGEDSYVSLAGRASLVEDQAKKEALFNTQAKAWFPQGATDPNLGLLAVRIEHAEYWDAKDSQMVQIFKMMKSAVTGQPPKDMTEHRTLDMS